MNILGIETSCDETAAAVVKNGTILTSSIVLSQIDIHKEFGGVVPEIAARSHIESILPVIKQALKQAFNRGGRVSARDEELWSNIDAIAVTYGPGLLGSLLIGVLTARTLAITKNLPLYAINHVEGHVYANFINSQFSGNNFHFSNNKAWEPPAFPLLALIVSGGHSQLVLFKDHGNYRLLGQTQDDAIGEAFDKVAKILGLPYPGGPSIAKAALKGNPNAYDFPIAKMSGKYDFSFSGLKTAVLRKVQEICNKPYDFPSFELRSLLNDKVRNDLAASFQKIAAKTVVDKTIMAYKEFQPASVVIGGGVAANMELRSQLKQLLPIEIEYASPSLCTDNAAMIASLAYFQAQHSKPVDPYSLEIEPSLRMAKNTS